MRDDIAIRVENLGKCYQIGQARSGDLRQSFGHWWDTLRGRSNGQEKAAAEKEFWALRDINFEIKRGEAVGIIGRNGAGKSTLLKILSRITEPSTGRFEINGRVSSLLEVGTGFHPELSGREHIYLNGTILGMKRREVKAKFDEIVAFSGVEKFIDTPVKHYSSGMKVRLAFSVAAHLEPEILIIDEVLAVGDAEFQKKCLGKMDEVSRNEGRTVVFVSHNMGAMQSLCNVGVLLEQGHLREFSNINTVIKQYMAKTNAKSSLSDGKWEFRSGLISSVEIFSEGKLTSTILSGNSLTVKVKFYSERCITKVVLGFAIISSEGVTVSAFNNKHTGDKLNTNPINYGCIEVNIPILVLYREDDYWIDIYFGDDNEDLEVIKNEVKISVLPKDVYDSNYFLKEAHNLFYINNVSYFMS